MKTLISVIIMGVLLCGCNSDDYKQSPTLVRSFKNAGNWDSVYLYSDGHLNIVQFGNNTRYFMFGYNYRLKNGRFSGDGNLYIKYNGFPTKHYIDSTLFEDFEYPKECYKTILINSIVEFKNADDWNTFTAGMVSDSIIKHKTKCQ